MKWLEFSRDNTSSVINFINSITYFILTNCRAQQQQKEAQIEHNLDEPETGKKVVTFMTTNHQVADTPLIFSRSSSLESLNSFVQQPFQGSEYSSYQCSRVTSGRVSPSDLPDSPIQSRPCTPPTKKPAPIIRPLTTVNQSETKAVEQIRTAFSFTGDFFWEKKIDNLP